MADSFSYDDAIGAAPVAPDASAAMPVGASSVPAMPAAASDTAPPLTVHASAPAPAAPASFSYDDAVGVPANPGALSNSASDGWLSGALKGAATGAIRGLSNVVGTVGNVSNLADLIMAGGEHLVTGKPVADVYADIQAQRAHQQAQSPLPTIDPRAVLPSGDDVSSPILKQTGAYQPSSALGKMGQAGVEAVTGAIGPGVGGAAEGATLAGLGASTLRMAPANFASGAASQAVTDQTGNPYLGMAAGFAAPMGVDALGGLAQRAAVGRNIPVLGPMAQSAQDARMGRQLLGMASDPAAAKAAVLPDVTSGVPSSVAVPGFKPTTGQLTGDTKLLQAETAMKTANNAPFNTRMGEQNAALQRSLGSVASPDADAMAPSTFLQNQLTSIDQATQDAQSRITAGAQALAAPLGDGQTAEQAGATIRAKVQGAADQAQQLRSSLYGAVDPTGTLASPTSSIGDAARSVVAGMSPYDEPLSGDEARIFGLAQAMPPVTPYRDLVAFDKNINSALPSATGSGKYRLGQLKTAVMGTLDGTVDGVAQSEAQQVAAGTRSSADTMMNRLQDAAPQMPVAGSSVFTPSGRQVGVNYRVMDASDLTASHLPDLTPNPDFPANLQPRDRSRAASDAQIADIAANLQPERLGASASAAEGAPIVGPDGIVESGNGRVLAIQRAHQQQGPQAQAYRQFLEGQGYDTSSLPQPVLVRQRVTPLTPEDRVRFAQEANASPVMAQSATERAATDAGRLSDGALSQYQGGEVSSAANRPFVRSFLGDVADKGEAGNFAAPDGALSLDGGRRVQNALLHAGYGDSGLVSSLAETGDPDIATFGNIMSDAAGRMAQLRRGIAAGGIHPGADLSAPVLEAARVVQRARSTGSRLADHVAQQDAFSPMSAEAHSVLQAAYGPALSSRLNRTKMGTYLGSALDEAAQQTASARLFGEPLSAGQILKSAGSRHAGFDTTPSDQLASGAGYPGPRPGEGGQEARGSRDGSRGAGAAGPGGGSGILDRPALAANMDPAAPARLRAAKDAHIDYTQRFVDGPVARAISTNGFRGQYDALPSAVPGMAIVKGDKGYDIARAFLRDTGNHPEAVEALTDHALNPLRKSLTPQGTVAPAAYAKWRQDYGPALRALDEASPGFSRQYESAAAATDLMTRAGALREAQLKAFKQSSAGKFLGKTDPSEIESAIGSLLDDRKAGPTQVKALVARMQSDPDALEGLRKAAAGYLTTKFSNATKEAGTGTQSLSATRLPLYIDQRRAALGALFSDQQIGQIRAVGHALDQMDRSNTATANKRTSQTSRDLHGLIQKVSDGAHGHSVMGGLIGAGALAAGEHLMEHGPGALLTPHGLLGAGSAAAVLALNHIRARGRAIDQATINDALMNPERFAHYVSKASTGDTEGRGVPALLASSLRRQLITQPIVARAMQGKPQAYARGGRIGGSRSGVDLTRADRDGQALHALAERHKAMNAAASFGRVVQGRGG